MGEDDSSGNLILSGTALFGLISLALCGSGMALMSFAGLGLYFIHQWAQGGLCTSPGRLDGKTVIVTGGNAGIGKETAKALAFRGAKVILACRDITKGTQAAEEIALLTKATVITRKLDLASFESVREFAKTILETEDQVHILVNNAGVMMCDYTKTEDGNELQMQTNHFGHFLLTLLLLPLLKKSAPARIVNVSSLAHKWVKGINFDDINGEKDYSKRKAYAQSKLANILFTRELAERLRGTKVTVYCVHPGCVNTGIAQHLTGDRPFIKFLVPLASCFIKTPYSGAQTTIYCAVDEGLANESGKYYSDCAEATPRVEISEETQKKLWELSAKVVNLEDFEIREKPKEARSDHRDDDFPFQDGQEGDTLESQALLTNIEDSSERVKTGDERVHEKFVDDVSSFEPVKTIEPSEYVTEKILKSDITDKESKEKHLEFSHIRPKEEEVVVQEESLQITSRIPEEQRKVDEIETKIPEFVETEKAKEVETIESSILPERIDDISQQLKFERNYEDPPLKPTETKEEDASDVLHREYSRSETIPCVSDLDQSTTLSHEMIKDKSSPPLESDIWEEKKVSDFLESAKSHESAKELVELAGGDINHGVEVLTTSFEKPILKETATEEKSILPSAATEIQEERKATEELLESIESFQPSESLKHVQSTKEPLNPVELLMSEVAHDKLVKDVASFERSNLKETTTQEKIALPDAADIQEEKKVSELLESIESFRPSESLKSVENVKEPITPTELLKSEMAHEKLAEAITSFEKSNLKETTTEEKVALPDAADIEEEKKVSQLLGSIESFEPSENLKHIKNVKEPISPIELFKSEIAHDKLVEDVASFEKSNLRETATEEKIVLPDASDIQEEKKVSELLESIESFKSSESLRPVESTKEPISPVELLKTELVHDKLVEDLVSFEKSSLKETTTEEKSVLPNVSDIQEEKRVSELLESIEHFEPSQGLKPVENTREAISPVELLKTEMAHEKLVDDLVSFEKSTLKETVTQEKLVLPDIADIQEEKKVTKLLESIESFEPSESLKPVGSIKEPISPVELLKKEIVHEKLVEDVSSFEKSKLKETTTQEKSVLPNETDIKEERIHRELLIGIESFDPDEKLRKEAVTREPLTGLDLAKQEIAHSTILSEVESYDRSRLTPTTVEEKNILPDAKTIASEKGNQGFDPPTSAAAAVVAKEAMVLVDEYAEGEKALIDVVEDNTENSRTSSDEWIKLDEEHTSKIESNT